MGMWIVKLKDEKGRAYIAPKGQKGEKEKEEDERFPQVGPLWRWSRPIQLRDLKGQWDRDMNQETTKKTGGNA